MAGADLTEAANMNRRVTNIGELIRVNLHTQNNKDELNTCKCLQTCLPHSQGSVHAYHSGSQPITTLAPAVITLRPYTASQLLAHLLHLSHHTAPC